MVHNRPSEFRSTYTLYTMMFIVHCKFLGKLCTIVERRDWIKRYFQCSLVPLNLCKKYLTIVTFKIPFLFRIKN